MDKIQKHCAVCGEAFIPKTVSSVYYSKNCSNAAYRKKKMQQKQEEQRNAVIARLS